MLEISGVPAAIAYQGTEMMQDELFRNLRLFTASGRGIPPESVYVTPRGSSLTLGIELKVWRDHRPDPIQQGLEQLDRYLAGLSQQTGWLVIFDQRTTPLPIGDRCCTQQATSPQGRAITVIRA